MNPFILAAILVAIILPATAQTQSKQWSSDSEKGQPALTQEQAEQLISKIASERAKTLAVERAPELKAKVIEHGDKRMRFDYLKYGDEPENGHSLFISMHGGGSGPARMNDGQWRNQLRLYKPTEGYYVAPRAPTNTWNLWHEGHIDPMFDRLIEDFVVLKGVNPNRVYLTGYSAGGDGTYQLAPRLADRFAAAAMMAGHPNEARPVNLYNLPFFIQMGGKDAAYDRNKIAAVWNEKLDKLAKENPGGYVHKTIIYPQYGHWMNGDDKVAIPWMLEKNRNPWPKTVVWHQDDITVKRFYWLYNENPQKDQEIRASVANQTITLETDNIKNITLRLHDKLIDLDQEITVVNAAGKQLFNGKVPRSREAIETSFKQRHDPATAATATLEISNL